MLADSEVKNVDETWQSVKLDFLTPGRRYEATSYADGPRADWQNAPAS